VLIRSDGKEPIGAIFLELYFIQCKIFLELYFIQKKTIGAIFYTVQSAQPS